MALYEKKLALTKEKLEEDGVILATMKKYFKKEDPKMLGFLEEIEKSVPKEFRTEEVMKRSEFS